MRTQVHSHERIFVRTYPYRMDRKVEPPLMTRRSPLDDEPSRWPEVPFTDESFHTKAIFTPPALLDSAPSTLATALAAPRRRVYEATHPGNPSALANLLDSSPAEPSPFRCGHTCQYITPAVRHILREVEPQMVCLWCLTNSVHNYLKRDLYSDYSGDWMFGSNDLDHGAIARYYISLLELYYELISPAGATLLAGLDGRARHTLNYLLWDQLSTFHTDEWLSEDGDLSLLQSANQVIRHLVRVKRYYNNQPDRLAYALGLDHSQMV